MEVLLLLLKYCFNFWLKQSECSCNEALSAKTDFELQIPFFGGSTNYFLFSCARLLSTLKTTCSIIFHIQALLPEQETNFVIKEDS